MKSDSQNNNNSIYTRTWVIILGSVISCGLWGSAAPCIKIGYELFQVNTANIFSIWLFAGIRFTLAGVLVALAVSMKERRLAVPDRKDVPKIIMLGLAQTTIQYFCYYIGVANSTGVKVSLYNGTGPFITVLVTCLIFGQEKLNIRKVIGCVIGFIGVAMVALDGSEGGVGGFTLIGEGMVVAACLSSAFASCLASKFTKQLNPLILCAYQFMFGGSMMILIGAAGGGHVVYPGVTGLGLIFYMGIISSVAFGVRMTLLRYNPVSRVTVYNFLTPIFGVFLSAIMLHEDAFRLKMLLALAFVVAGIYVVNKKNQ